MKTVKTLAALAGLAIVGCTSTPPPPQTQVTAVACGKQQPLQVMSLNFFPDPVPQTRRIDQWRAIIRSDGIETCRTVLQVTEKDKDQPASAEYNVHLNPGTNTILINGDEQYRLRGSELCFQVVGTVEGVRTPLAGWQGFCGKPMDKEFWTMR